MKYVIKILLINALILVLLLFGTISTFIISNHLSGTEERKNYPEAIEKIKASEDIDWLRNSFASTVKLRHNTNAGLVKWHNKSFYFLLILSGLSVLNIYFLFNLRKQILSNNN
jgi:hypothetical protein